MQKFVRLGGDIVVENIAIAEGADIQEMFHPSVKLVAVAAPVTIGWVYNATSNEFSAPAALVPSKDELKAHAAAQRYKVETGGISIGGVSVATDRESQAMLNAAYNIAQGNPQFQTMWKGSDGTFNALDAPTVIALAQAVGAFVAACFSAEAAVAAKITAETITTYAEVDAALVVPA
jgi:hypothetical protein